MTASPDPREIARLLDFYRTLEPREAIRPRSAENLIADVAWLLSTEIVLALHMTYQREDDYAWYGVPPTMDIRIAHVSTAEFPVKGATWALMRYVHMNDRCGDPAIDHWELVIPEKPGIWIASDGFWVGQAEPPHALLSHDFRVFLLEAILAA